MYQVNRSFYDAPQVVDNYAATTTLQRAEETILQRHRRELAGARLLEIGVGPGRTTPHIRGLVRQYVGIDYSAAMLAPCRQRYRDAQLALCDGRMLAFPTASFDAVYFCWNAIDDVDHADRQAMLAEIARALRPRGLFFFSTHNRLWKPKSPYTAFYQPSKYVRRIINHLRHRKFERREEEYAIVNEPPGDFCTLTYFIDRRQQIAQLARHGFGEVEMVALDGRIIDADEPCGDGWIYYVGRRRVD